MAKDYDKEDGVWRTIGGRKVFIRKGQNLADAMIESGKFSKKGKMRESYRKAMDEDEKVNTEAFDKWNANQTKKNEDELRKQYDNMEELYPEYFRGDKYFEKTKAFEKENGKTYPYREQYKQEGKEDLEKEKDWEGYRNRYQKTINRSSNPDNREKYVQERDMAQREIDKARKNLNEKADEILGKQDKIKNQLKTAYDGELNDLSKGWAKLSDSNEDSEIEQKEIKSLAKEEMKARKRQDKEDEKETYIQKGKDVNGNDSYVRTDVDKDGYKTQHTFKTREEAENYKNVDDYLNRDKSNDKLNYNENTKEDTLHSGTFRKKEDNSTNETMNNAIREKAGVSKKIKNDVDRANKQGDTTNDKEAQRNAITQDIIDYHDSLDEKGKQEFNEKMRQGMTPREIVDEAKNKSTSNYNKYSADEQDILDRYSEDYGYDKGDNLKNLKGQIDYMRIPNESIHKTAERLVEGGDFLIYNEDIKNWLKERNIKFNDDNFFDKYKKVMADDIEILYNKANNQSFSDSIRKQATMKDAYKQYMKDHPESKMSLSQFKKMKK